MNLTAIEAAIRAMAAARAARKAFEEQHDLDDLDDADSTAYKGYRRIIAAFAEASVVLWRAVNQAVEEVTE